MKAITTTISAILISFALAACSGCKTVAPGGAYDGDSFLYNAEATVNASYVVFDTFVKWEYDNRATLEAADAKAAAEVKQAADHVRTNGRTIINSAIAAVELYKAAPNAMNKEKLSEVLRALQEEVNKAVKYIKS